MNKKEQLELLVNIKEFLEIERNNLTLRELRSNIVSYCEFNLKIAMAFGCDVDRVFGSDCIVVDRSKFHGSHPNPPPTGSWDGIGDYTQNLHHILKHLIPADIRLEVNRGKIVLTEESGPAVAPLSLTYGNDPEQMMGGWAIVGETAGVYSVSMPRALLLAGVLWKLSEIEKDEGLKPV